jgi:hypothetical protein
VTNGAEPVIEEARDNRLARRAATATVFYCSTAMTKS